MFGTGEMERNAVSWLRLSSSRDSNRDDEQPQQSPRLGLGSLKPGDTGSDLWRLLGVSESVSQLHVSSLNITLRTGFGGTGSPHVHTHSHVAGGRDACPD